MRQRPDYGVDGPIAVTLLFLLGGVLLGSVAALAGSGAPRPYGNGPRVGVALLGADLLAIAGGLLWYSRVGKGHLRGWLLDRIPWRGDESVLDVGCGRGLLLVEAARRLT